MIYKDFKGLKLSQLGMGNMRLPTLENHGPIDEVKARQIIQHAYESGINYFDTAYRYHSGESESFVGKVLSQYPRDSYYIATKMPGHMMNYKDNKPGFQGYLSGAQIGSLSEIFEQQLSKCGVEYFDFYLLHNLCESSYDLYTNDELGVVDYLLQEKAAGRIRYLGFSAHGSADTIESFLNYRDCFDFVQIQLNFLDWHLQDAKRKYELLTNRGIPVMVMEPCRGGVLISFDDEINGMLKAARPDDSIASWAFSFVKSLSNVLVVLSGMNEISQMDDNIKTFSDPNPLTDEESKLLDKVTERLIRLVPCTACRYCCEECPQGLDIPKLISLYNEMSYAHSPGLMFTIAALKDTDMPHNCIACEACKHPCPQSIEIPKIMQELAVLIDEYKS